MLLALGNPTVDYFALDVEGVEIPVLETIPFEKVPFFLLDCLLKYALHASPIKVDIRMLQIEVNKNGVVLEGTLDTLKRFLEKKGYQLFNQKLQVIENSSAASVSFF